jgi:hypothetical protein
MQRENEIRLATGKSEQAVTEKANVPGAAFGWGTVVCVTEHEVEIVRPYVHTSNFTMGAGRGELGERLVSYIGQEVCRIPRYSDRVFTIVFRSQVPK